MIEFLGSDLLEGRAPGTRGGRLAEAYIKSLFKLWGLEPGHEGRYLQPVALKGHAIKQLELRAGETRLTLGDDVMGTFAAQERAFSLRGDAVFIGFGIKTDLWRWDDFKGVDLKGKIVIARVGDPGMFIPDVFEGKTLTYFGRWTYHVAEAARRGAAAILLIHTDRTAGYGWGVVKSSWGKEALLLEDDAVSSLKFRGWIKERSLERVLTARKIDLGGLYKRSLSRTFKPEDLGFAVTIQGSQELRRLVSHNVVATIKGRSPRRIVLSAHIDHLGQDDALEGDTIYNGAIDNASAVAAMMLTARALQREQGTLRHSVTLLATNAEEAGLLGSTYYVRHTDRASIVANINFESTPVWEPAGSIMGVGARFSTLEGMIRAVARRQGLRYSEFSMSDQGFFYRSDQFPFARHGIPAVWLSAGEDDRSGKRKYPAFWKTTYHTVDDAYRPTWPLGALRQTIRSAVLLVREIDRAPRPPRWKRVLTFPTAPARDVRGGGAK